MHVRQSDMRMISVDSDPTSVFAEPSNNLHAAFTLRCQTPSDLAATIFHHFGIPANVQYLDYRGRPRYVLDEKGKAIEELV